MRMNVRLFRAFPDPFRKSMEIYADQLLRGIRPLLQNHETIDDCLPSDVRLKGSARYWDQYVRYQWLSRSFQGDVNHIIDHGYGHLVYTLPAHKTVVTFHDSTVNTLSGMAYSTRLSVQYSFTAMRKAARIITDSHVSRRDFLSLVNYPENHVEVVYPGIDPAFQPLQDREELKRRLSLPGTYILHVGHTLPYMNVEKVLMALECLVKRHGIDAHLVKVGDAFTRGHEALLDRLDLKGRVIHLGKIPLKDLIAIYNCADALLYPVLYAGFGLPPLEAMACGIPVVCSDRGALPEIVGDAAIMTDPEDHQQIAAHVAVLLADSSVREAYRAKGLRQAQKYSWDNTARQVLAIYRQVHESA